MLPDRQRRVRSRWSPDFVKNTPLDFVKDILLVRQFYCGIALAPAELRRLRLVVYSDRKGVGPRGFGFSQTKTRATGFRLIADGLGEPA